MEEARPGLVAPDAPSRMTPAQRALAGAGFFVLAVAVMVALEGGRPASLWFYPCMGIIGVALINRTYTIGGRLVTVPRESKRRSFEWALLEAAALAVFMYLLYFLLSADRAFRPSGWVLPLLVVYVSYCRRRGEKPSTKATFLLGLGGFAWYVVVLELIRALR